ncbi:MAG: hypothetical protein FOGNACKC_00508 [Anaerolineae bacterium]|nr:hypothetical protein [Anaerolineae bacterium]
MIEPSSYKQLKTQIAEVLQGDQAVLDELRADVRSLRSNIRRIQPRNTTAISLVGTDGGNNKVQYDPFLVQVVRVVDSSNNEHFLEPVTPTTKISQVSSNQFNEDGTPKSALGEMMEFLGIDRLEQLSGMINSNDDDLAVSPGWIQVYRELVEWAVLFSLVKKDYGTDTLIVFDGLLRTKKFAKDLFKKYREGIEEAIDSHYKKNRRKIYLVGMAKHNKVLDRYRLAMALEKILTTDYPAYLEVPRILEQRSYVWKEWFDDTEAGEVNKFVGGKLFFVKFGNKPLDPIWPIDIFLPQVSESQAVMGYLLADALNGFPVPFYPLCLQKAHENAALVDFDFDILQDQIFDGIRLMLGSDSPVLDIARIQESDPSRFRYG